MTLSNKSQSTLTDVKKKMNKNNDDRRRAKITQLTIMINGRDKKYLQLLLNLHYYKKLGITNTKDLAYNIAVERVRYTSNLPLSASVKAFYYEWKTMSTRKANDE